MSAHSVARVERARESDKSTGGIWGDVPESTPFKGSVLAALEGKNILVTGATGFLGKILVEKLLRSVPNLGLIYVLVRPRKGQPAQERLEKEIISSEIFARLRSERPDFDTFIRKKLVPFAGELTMPNVGFSAEDRATLVEHLDVVIHCAAVVDFNERVDRALELNTLGTLRLFEIAQGCKHVSCFIHVSTAYVNSNREGWVDEKLYPLGFDAEAMVKRIQSMSETELSSAAISGLLGGWPNTYTFTKAMTETLLVQKRGRMPLVILRPSIIGSCWQEPVPGWVDVISAAGAIYMAVGFGVLKMLPGQSGNIADCVPADYVVNAMIASIPAIWGQDKFFVSHACTSSEKPMEWGIPQHEIMRYYRESPPDRFVATPEFGFVTQQEYQVLFFLRYSIPSALLNTLAMMGMPGSREKAAMFEKLVFRVRVIVEAFQHFVTHEWFFCNKHTQAVGRSLNPTERKIFPLSLDTLDWYTYNREFGYGLMRYMFKADIVDVPTTPQPRLSLTNDRWVAAPASVTYMRRLAPDLTWSKEHLDLRTKLYPQPRPVLDMRQVVLTSAPVRAAIEAEAKIKATKQKAAKPGAKPLPSPLEAAEIRAKSIIDQMFADQQPNVLNGLGYGFRKIWRRLYSNISVDEAGVARARELASKGPIVFIPTHRSYVDFLIVSYMCMATQLPMPYIAAGEDFLGMLLVRWLFRKSGAFFLRRSYNDGTDVLYATIFREYVQRILCDGQSIEFFIEGTRSRSGKMLHPKMGLLSIITDAFLEKRVKNDITIVPLAINYEKTMEGDLYSSELMGNSKVRESLRALLSSSSVLNRNFGSITVTFSEPLSLAKYTADQCAAMSTKTSLPLRLQYTANPGVTPVYVQPDSKDSKSSGESKNEVFRYDPIGNKEHRRHYNRTLAYKIVHDMTRVSECMPTHLVATLMLMYRHGITRHQLVQKVDWLRREVEVRGMRVANTYAMNRTNIVNDAVTHLGATIVERRQNVLEAAIASRHEYKNMLVLGQYRNKITHLFFREGIVACALYALGGHGADDVTPGKKNGSANVPPAVTPSSSSSSANLPQTSLPLSATAALTGVIGSTITTAIHRRSGSSDSLADSKEPAVPVSDELHVDAGNGAPREALLKEMRFLHSLLHREFIYQEHPDTPEDFEATLTSMMKRGIITEANGHIQVGVRGESMFSFLCALLWPFIDSYLAASMILFSLQPDLVVEESVLLQRTQWLATTLYHESMLCFYESCSLETLRNALTVLYEWQVIKVVKGKDNKLIVSLLPPYQDEKRLEELVGRLSRLRKQPPVRKAVTRRNLIADVPILAKL